VFSFALLAVGRFPDKRIHIYVFSLQLLIATDAFVLQVVLQGCVCWG
jgi:hypothetical protein